MGITAKKYLEMIAEDLRKKDAAVSVEEDGEKAILTAAYILPAGVETKAYLTLEPAANDMLLLQIMADFTQFFPPETDNDLNKKISEVNNSFFYGSINFNDTEENRYCIYNFGSLIDSKLDLGDMTVMLGDSITNAELEFCSQEVSDVFGAYFKAND